MLRWWWFSLPCSCGAKSVSMNYLERTWQVWIWSEIRCWCVLFSCSAEYFNSSLLWSSRTVLWTTTLHLTATRPSDQILLIVIWTWSCSTLNTVRSQRGAARRSVAQFGESFVTQTERESFQLRLLQAVVWAEPVSRKPPTNRFLLVSEAPDTNTTTSSTSTSTSSSSSSTSTSSSPTVWVCRWTWQRASGANKSHNSSNQQRRREGASGFSWCMRANLEASIPTAAKKKKNRRQWTQHETWSLFVFWLQKDGHMIICSSLWTIGSPQNHHDVHYSVTSTQTQKYIK